MGLGNFIKKQAGVGRLPQNQLNEVTVYNILKRGAPFTVSLPILESRKVSNGHSISSTQGGFRQTFYTPAEYKKARRVVSTTVLYHPKQITIMHAKANGKNIAIKTNKIAGVGALSDGLIVELIDGSQYIFVMDKNFWQGLGFNLQFVITVTGKLWNGTYLRKLEQQKINEKEALKQQKEALKVQKIIEKERAKQEKEILKEQKRIEKERIKQQEKIDKDNLRKRKKLFDDFSIKMKTLKESFDADALSQEEYDALKTKFIDDIKFTPIPEDVNPLEKIKECKELLDLDLLTQEEFDELKNKYLKTI